MTERVGIRQVIITGNKGGKKRKTIYEYMQLKKAGLDCFDSRHIFNMSLFLDFMNPIVQAK